MAIGGGTRAHAAPSWWGDEAIHAALLSLPAKKYKKVTGKEIYSDTLESTPMLEKEKFPQDYFPEVRGRGPAGGGWDLGPGTWRGCCRVRARGR